MNGRRAAGRSIPLVGVIAPVVFVAVLAYIAVQTWPAWEVLAFGAVAIAVVFFTGRGRLLDRFRSRLTDELQIAPPAGEARRGEEIDVAVTVVDARRLSGVEVGLVCTEYYDVEVQTTSTDHNGHSTRRVWRKRAVRRLVVHPMPGVIL